jgi:hypothetical protein
MFLRFAFVEAEQEGESKRFDAEEHLCEVLMRESAEVGLLRE